jgi:hypothetical protein
MTWLSILGIVVILIAIVSVIGFQPKGAKPVGGTRLMSVARVFLVIFGLILLYIGYHARP